MHGDCPRLVVTAAPPDVVVTATAPPARQTSVRAARVRSPGSWRRPMPACSTGCSRAAARTPPARGGDGAAASLERDLGVEPHVAAAAANVLRAIRVDTI